MNTEVNAPYGWVICKPYRDKSGKVHTHPTGFYKFPRREPNSAVKVKSSKSAHFSNGGL